MFRSISVADGAPHLSVLSSYLLSSWGPRDSDQTNESLVRLSVLEYSENEAMSGRIMLRPCRVQGGKSESFAFTVSPALAPTTSSGQRENDRLLDHKLSRTPY